MDFRPSEEQEILRRTVREFAESEMRPHVMEWDEAQHFPMELLPKLAELGLMGVQLDEQYGGAGMSAVDYCICIEELARVCPAIALSVAAHNGLCSSHIAMFGSEAQKQRYLPRLVKGEVLGAWCLTEAAAGSDAAAMRTTATRQGECWVINGSKQFITHGTIGGVMVVMAVTDRTKAHRGISAFVVEHGTPGVRPGKKENKLGMRASDTSEVVFSDCRVPEENLLGKRGDGFVNSLQVLDGGRISIAALALGMATGACEAATKYAQERKQFGKPIAEFEGIQFKLADMVTEISAAQMLVYHAAWLADKANANGGGIRFTRESSMAKLYASEAAVRVANEAVQVFGGYGFIKDYPAEKFYRDVKLCTIGEGTSEIQRLVIARHILGKQ